LLTGVAVGGRTLCSRREFTDWRSAQPFATVRGIFTEGGELYPGGRIMAKTHVQVCVRDPEKSIKGYFRPLPPIA
jgi:hypothetical protein